jgi:hypothetical protein
MALLNKKYPLWMSRSWALSVPMKTGIGTSENPGRIFRGVYPAMSEP